MTSWQFSACQRSWTDVDYAFVLRLGWMSGIWAAICMVMIAGIVQQMR